MAKVLNVVERAYHATLEEQDDVALWFALAMWVQGSLDQSVLLRGAAVNYLVRTQDASGLKIGDLALDPPPKIVEDLALLQEKGLKIFALEEDLDSRAAPRDRLIPGVELVRKSALPELFGRHDRIFYW